MKPPISLIATIGISPSVLTEFIYQLYKNGDGPIKTIDILTTKEGVNKLKPLFGNRGAYYDLLDYFEIPYTDITVNGHNTPILDELGRELEDIRTREDDLQAAKAIYEIVQKRTAEPNSRVYALLSGGRKTMVSHLGSAMQIFGREDDQVYHILVGDDFEKPGFYFPYQSNRHFDIKDRNGTVIKTVDAQEAQIDLIQIPFVRLRNFLEEKIDFSLPYEKLLAHIDQALMTDARYPVKSLQISLFESCIYVNGLQNKIGFEPRKLSLLAFFALINKIENRITELSLLDILQSPMYMELLHVLYRQISIGARLKQMSESNRQHEYEEFELTDTWYKLSYWEQGESFHKKAFPKTRSKLIENLKQGLSSLPNNTLSASHIFEYIAEKSNRDALKTRQRCTVPPKNIRFIHFFPEELEEVCAEYYFEFSFKE